MQNRYAGDIGDYIKLAILRHLANGHRLGVAWWLFPGEKNGDGRHILEHPEKWMRFDPFLFRGLGAIVRSEQRTVASLHKLLPMGTRFACDQIPLRVEVEPAIEVSAMVACSGSERTHVRFL